MELFTFIFVFLVRALAALYRIFSLLIGAPGYSEDTPHSFQRQSLPKNLHIAVDDI